MVELKRTLFALLATAGLAAMTGCCCGPCGSCRGRTCGSSCGSACGSSCGGACGSSCGGACGSSCGGSCGLCSLFCRRTLPDDYRGAGSYYCGCGCGELYLGDWRSSPPKCCDPCDCNGNYAGFVEQGPAYQLPPRAGTLGHAPLNPAERAAPTSAPKPPIPPNESGRVDRSGNATQVSYQTAPHCATCGN